MKTIGIGAVNARLKRINEYFMNGVNDSQVVIRAQHYLEANVDDKYLKKDAQGNIIGIKQSKDAKNDPKLYLRPEALNEYVPDVRELFKEQKRLAIDEAKEANDEQRVKAYQSMTLDDMMYDKTLSSYFSSKIEEVYGYLNNQDDEGGIVDELYAVDENRRKLHYKTYSKWSFKSRAATLIEELRNGKGRDRAWVRDVAALVEEYRSKVEEQVLRRIEAKKAAKKGKK